MTRPVLIRMHAADNVAVVGNDGGLPEGTVVPDGPTLREKLPQAHKVALADITSRRAPRCGATAP